MWSSQKSLSNPILTSNWMLSMHWLKLALPLPVSTEDSLPTSLVRGMVQVLKHISLKPSNFQKTNMESVLIKVRDLRYMTVECWNDPAYGILMISYVYWKTSTQLACGYASKSVGIYGVPARLYARAKTPPLRWFVMKPRVLFNLALVLNRSTMLWIP